MSSIDYPHLFNVAERLSTTGRRRYLKLVATELALTCLAALSSDLIHVLPLTRILATFTLGCLIVGFSIELARLRGVFSFDKAWVEGRAVAESTKTLSWQYMMKVPPFVNNEEARHEFMERLGNLI